VIAITLLLAAWSACSTSASSIPSSAATPFSSSTCSGFTPSAVYIMVLPAMGVISEIIPTFARKPIFGYSFIAGSSIAIASSASLFGPPHVRDRRIHLRRAHFLAAQLLGGHSFRSQVFNWTSTLYKGSISYDTPMLYASALSASSLSADLQVFSSPASVWTFISTTLIS